jgi:hypothetical protein
MSGERCGRCGGLMVDADSLWASSWGELFEDVCKVEEEPKIREITTGISCVNCGHWIEIVHITRPEVPAGDTRPKNKGPAISVARGSETRKKIEKNFNTFMGQIKDGVTMKFIANSIGMNYATFYSHFRAVKRDKEA